MFLVFTSYAKKSLEKGRMGVELGDELTRKKRVFKTKVDIEIYTYTLPPNYIYKKYDETKTSIYFHGLNT